MDLNLPFTKQLLNKADSGSEVEELEKLVQLNQGTRDELRNSQAQFDLYATTVNQNLITLKEFVKGDIEQEERLGRLIKNISSEQLTATLEKIEGDEKVSLKSTNNLLSAVQSMKNDITHMEAGISLSVGDIVTEYKRQIVNDSNSTEQQMKVLGGLLSVMSKEQRMLQAEVSIYSAQDKKDLEEDQLKKLETQEISLKKLKEHQAGLAKFAKLDSIAYKEHSQEVERLLDAASDQTDRSRLLTSLNNVDSQLEQLGIDSKQLATVTQKLEESQGEDIAGKKERDRLSDVKTTAKAGVASYILEGLGLGGLDQLFGISEKVGEFSLGSLFGKDKKGERGKEGRRKGGVKGLLGRATGMFGGSIKESEEYQGTRQALEDVGFGGRKRDRGGRDRDRGGRSRKSSKFGRLLGGAGSLLGLDSLTDMIPGGSNGSPMDSALDTMGMAGDVGDATSREGTKKPVKGAGKKSLAKGALKVGGKAAMLGSAAAVAGAGFAGWKIGSFINKMISEKTGREDWLFSKISDRREARAKVDQEKQMKKYASKFKGIMTPSAFELMGGDENFDIKRFMKLRSSKAIISTPDQTGGIRWMTSEEAGKKTKGTIQKMQDVIEQDQGIVEKKIDHVQTESPIATEIIEESGIVQKSMESGKKVVKAVMESAPDVLKDATTRILEVERHAKQILAGIAGNTAQTANIAIQPRSEGSSTDRKLNIQDSDLLFIRSVLLG